MNVDEFFDTTPQWLDLTATSVLLAVVPATLLFLTAIGSLFFGVLRVLDLQRGHAERVMQFRMQGGSVLGKAWEAQQASAGR